MTALDAAAGRTFAEEWLEAWNHHDIDRVLSHYADDFEMHSPVIATREGIPEGILVGKARVGAYWRKALDAYPELRFELVDVLRGIDYLTIYYRGATGRHVAETFVFDAHGKVRAAYAAYA